MLLIRAENREGQAQVQALSFEARVESNGALEPASNESGFEHPDEISRLQAALAALEARHEQLIAAATEQGKRDALAAHKRDEAAHAAKLASAIDASVAAFLAKVEELNRSAAMICENTLATLIGDARNHRELIAAAVSQQLRKLQQDAIIAVRVSSADFPDEAALSAIGTSGISLRQLLVRDQSMESGACKIELRLGTIEISLPAYWKALQASLGDLKLQGGRR
jgi:flagellar biosynthesis/type III secretory pathway protein FliH